MQNEQDKQELAQLVATSALHTAGVPVLQFGEIQTRRVALRRWSSRYVCDTSRSLHVLLEKVLLVFIAWHQCAVRPLLFTARMKSYSSMRPESEGF